LLGLAESTFDDDRPVDSVPFGPVIEADLGDRPGLEAGHKTVLDRIH
jgi:hypothetical protein